MQTKVRWDLSDLYSGIDDPRIDRHLTSLRKRAQAFEKAYRGKIASAKLTAARLCAALRELEAIYRAESKVGAYAHLHFSTNTMDPRRGALLQKVSEQGTRIATHLIFFDLEVGKIPGATYRRISKDPMLAEYRHHLDHEREVAKYFLTEPEEKVMEEMANSGRRAFGRLFTEVTSRQKFRVVVEGEDKELTQSELLSLLYEPNRETRRAAAESFTRGLRENAHVVTYTFNTMLQEKAVIDRLRKYEYPEQARHLGNEVSPEIVDTVVSVCRDNYRVVADYYRLKRDLLGLDELTHYDRYAPILDQKTEMTWPDAKRLVLESFAAFSPRVSELTEPFFSRNWIDAAVAPGKSGGAYCAGITPDHHPYVFMNYTGKPRDVMTLAHELGHGLHDRLASRQNMYNYHPPLPLAETASTFGEMLVFDRLLRDLEDPKERLALLCEKIEDTFATVFRQVAMYRFEQACHRKRREAGEQTTESYSALWQSCMQEMFGRSVKLGADHACWWLYIPHVFQSPFYVYAYAFGELLVLSLYARYQQIGKPFIDRYLELLAAGGSERPDRLLKRTMGIDIKNRAFWQGGVDLIAGRVREARRVRLRVG